MKYECIRSFSENGRFYRTGVIISDYQYESLSWLGKINFQKKEESSLTGNQTGPSNSTEGFLTTHNRFLDRKDAVFIAYLNKQITKEQFQSIKELYSEDLW